MNCPAPPELIASQFPEPHGGKERTVARIVAAHRIAALQPGVVQGAAVAALALYLTCGAGLGWLLAAGVPPAQRTAILLSTGIRDFAEAAGIAASAFGAPAAAPLGIYGILVLIFGTAAVYLIRRRQASPDGGPWPDSRSRGAPGLGRATSPYDV